MLYLVSGTVRKIGTDYHCDLDEVALERSSFRVSGSRDRALRGRGWFSSDSVSRPRNQFETFSSGPVGGNVLYHKRPDLLLRPRNRDEYSLPDIGGQGGFCRHSEFLFRRIRILSALRRLRPLARGVYPIQESYTPESDRTDFI